MLGEPHHDPKVRQGVTTELVGIDGISHAPYKSQEEYKERSGSTQASTGTRRGLPTGSAYSTCTASTTTRISINVAVILGNAPVRIWSVGWNDRPATAAEIEDMRSVTREAMEEGAWGLSSGLDYPPGSFASTDELVALAEVSAQYGGFYHTHTRALLREYGLLAPWKRRSTSGGAPAFPFILRTIGQGRQGVGSHLDYIGLVERGRDEGMDVTFDCYSYPYSGTTLLMLVPNWTMDGGPERAIAAFKDSDDRDRIRREVDRETLSETWLTNFRRPHNMEYEGKSITEIAHMRSQDPVDAIMDLLVDENLSIHIVGTGTNQHTLPAFVSHPYGIIASDAISSASTRTLGRTDASRSCWPSSYGPRSTSDCRRRFAR